ncbi:STAS domain-containing protein [Pseudonocardia sp. H11422]|uniref:STAS domain-containing protein n=1 Tax=Pseudonocardia sp. H11422 TaxID=2835866 RepID=UPI001BDD81E3|nr:STAS domain-containing protein [Pseudonocardia sp. H11422]
MSSGGDGSDRAGQATPGPVADPGGAALQAHRELHGSVVAVTLTGELDMSTLAQAEREVSTAEAATAAVLLVDLSGLDFVDSSGVRLVLEADARARTDGRRLVVALGGGLPRRLFEVLGLMSRLDIVDSRDDILPLR